MSNIFSKAIATVKNLFSGETAPVSKPVSSTKSNTTKPSSKQVPANVDPKLLNKEYKGKLVFFNYKRGFGFIDHEPVSNKIFVHVSDLDKNARKGDLVTFKLTNDKKGYRAIEAKKVA